MDNMEYCKICFVELEKEKHQAWCPFKPIYQNKEGKVDFDSLFPGLDKTFKKE